MTNNEEYLKYHTLLEMYNDDSVKLKDVESFKKWKALKKIAKHYFNENEKYDWYVDPKEVTNAIADFYVAMGWDIDACIAEDKAYKKWEDEMNQQDNLDSDE